MKWGKLLQKRFPEFVDLKHGHIIISNTNLIINMVNLLYICLYLYGNLFKQNYLFCRQGCVITAPARCPPRWRQQRWQSCRPWRERRSLLCPCQAVWAVTHSMFHLWSNIWKHIMELWTLQGPLDITVDQYNLFYEGKNTFCLILLSAPNWK